MASSWNLGFPPALEESLFRGRQLVCTRGSVSYGLTPTQALLPLLVENKKGFGYELLAEDEQH